MSNKNKDNVQNMMMFKEGDENLSQNNKGKILNLQLKTPGTAQFTSTENTDDD